MSSAVRSSSTEPMDCDPSAVIVEPGSRPASAAGESELVAFEPSSTEFKEIAKYKLSPGTGLAYPIVAGNRVYVKGNTELTLWTID